MGRTCSITEGGLECTVEVYKPEESVEEVTVLQVGTHQGADPGVRVAKSSEFEEGEK